MALDHTDVDYWMIPGPYNTAAMSYLAGLEHDPGNAELEDGRRCAMDEVEKSPLGAEATENVARARADPELAAILADPVMERLLVDLTSDPAALAATRMKGPEVAAKVQKLIDAGIIKLLKE